MNGIMKTFFIYLPFIILLMIFYWTINEIEIQYPVITINDSEIIYDINYKYKTTLIPFIYDYTKEGRSPNYSDSDNKLPLKKVKMNEPVNITLSKMDYDITNMYIVSENNNMKTIYKGKYTSDITKYLTEPGIYRVSLYSKLYKRFYYDGYVDYKFKIEVLG